MSDAHRSGCRVLAVFGHGEERVLDAAIEAAERGRGRLIVASCPTVSAAPAIGAFYADCSALAHAHISRVQAFTRAVDRVPLSMPVLTVRCEHEFLASLRRLVTSQLPDLAFVATRRHARRLERFGLEDVVVVGR